jgi:hypothetical protein
MSALKKLELQNKLNFKVNEVSYNSNEYLVIYYSYDEEHIGIGIEKTNSWQIYSIRDSLFIKEPSMIRRNKNGFWESSFDKTITTELLRFDRFENERIILDLKNILETNLTDFSKKVKNDFKEFIINFENKINDEF